MNIIGMAYRVLFVSKSKDRTFTGMKLHFVVKFPFLKNIKVFLEGHRVRGVRDGSVEKTVIGKEAEFSARRKVIMDIINVDEEK